MWGWLMHLLGRDDARGRAEAAMERRLAETERRIEAAEAAARRRQVAVADEARYRAEVELRARRAAGGAGRDG